MNSSEIKIEIAKVEAEIKKLVEEANNKFNILSGMKNAYQKVVASLEADVKALEADAKTDATKDVAAAATAVETKL